jgi:hypothetical protein
MFPNRISGFVMSFDNPQDGSRRASMPHDERRATGFLLVPVQTGDIYQAALNRALQDYELDKLFNPEHYDFQI